MVPTSPLSRAGAGRHYCNYKLTANSNMAGTSTTKLVGVAKISPSSINGANLIMTLAAPVKHYVTIKGLPYITSPFNHSLITTLLVCSLTGSLL